MSELSELREAVNCTRVAIRGLQNQARAAVRLASDLEERLERFDSQLRQRQAMEAKHEHEEQNQPHPVPA